MPGSTYMLIIFQYVVVLLKNCRSEGPTICIVDDIIYREIEHPNILISVETPGTYLPWILKDNLDFQGVKDHMEF